MLAPRKDEPREFFNLSVQMVRTYSRRLAGGPDTMQTRSNARYSPRWRHAQHLRGIHRQFGTRDAVRLCWQIIMQSHESETRPSATGQSPKAGGVEVGTGSVACRAGECGPDQRVDRVPQKVAGEAHARSHETETAAEARTAAA